MDYDDLELLTPRRRRILGWTAGIVLLLACAALALHLYGRSRLGDLRAELRRHGPLDPAAYAPPVAPAADNAAAAFLAAAGDVVTAADDLPALQETRMRRPAAWSPEARAAVARQLAANAAPLAALHRAASLPGGGLDLDYTRFNPSHPTAPWDLMPAGRLLEIEGHSALADGDLEKALRAVETLGRLAALLHAEPEVVLQILALDAGAAQLRTLREILAAGPPAELVPRLERALAPTADRSALARTIRRQTAILVGADSGRIAHGIGEQAGGLWRPASWIAGELLLAEGTAGRAQLARVDELPYPQLAAAAEAAASELPLGPFESLHVELQAVALKAGAAAASRQLAVLALALTASGARDGRYPTELPDHPAAVTPDPITASLPTYRLAADGSARLSLEAAEAQAGSADSLASLPFVWELPPPRPPHSWRSASIGSSAAARTAG